MICKRVKCKYVIIVLFTCLNLFTAVNVHSQAISGIIKNNDNKGIENATIKLQTQSDSTIANVSISDKNGYFELSNIKIGSYNLLVSSLGYEAKRIESIQFNNISLDLKKITLDKSVKKLQEIIIQHHKPLIERKIDRLIFNLDGSLFANDGSLLEALRVAPLLNVSENSISMVGKGSMGIMIDERPIQLSGGDLINYLKALRSENVERVEIITNPPAKYGAQGNSGLINIVMKKNNSLGWKATLNASFRQQTYSSYDNSILLEYRSKKVKSTLNLNHFRYKNIIKEENNIHGNPNDILSNSHRWSINPGMLTGITTNYEINNFNNIGFIYNLSRSKNNSIILNESQFATQSKIDSILSTNSERRNVFLSHTFNIYHDLKIDSTGKKLNSSFNFFSNLPETNNDFTSESNIQSTTIRNNNDSQYKIWSIQSDLTIPYKWAKFETGGKFSRINNNSNVAYYRILNNFPILDPKRSNKFNYIENNIAAYFSLESEITKKWAAKFGLRYELTNLEGYSLTLNQRHKSNYGSLFPTAYLVYKKNKDHTYSLNYSRRIDRPGLNYLNPFAIYSNLYSYQIGNPYLLPSYSHNIELSYLLKGTYSFTIYTQHLSNIFSAVTTVDGPAVISRAENFLNQNNWGIYATFNQKMFTWWENNTNASFSLVAPKSKLENVITEKGTSASFQTNNYFKVQKKLSLFVNYRHNFPSTFGNTYNYSQRNLTLGGSMLFLEDKLSLKVSYFLGSLSKYDIQFKDFVQSVSTDYDYRTFNIRLSYTFGKSKVSGNNKNISFDETKRAQD